ncbi:MAG: saccharopine dehydrogenase NADP-binding domain-containing protein [Leptospirales bacterium]|nr:saccharopine dehydrogenase NADP-binding domain-containing protein [Leptospirales bacterium]
MAKRWMIYGATGFSGVLIAERAVELGLAPILAGRDESKLAPLAERLGLQYCAFSLDDSQRMVREIEATALVLHCAGPFVRTARPMLEACIDAGASYIDITGEIPVFEMADSLHERARDRGVMLMPGAGFDVCPTDCAALRARRLLPDAAEISLAFVGQGSLSAGTARSALLQLPEGGRIRRGGRLIQTPLMALSRTIAFGAALEVRCYSIPWGDLFTASRSTGAQDITVYTHAPFLSVTAARAISPFRKLLSGPWLSASLESLLAAALPGPDARTRETGQTLVWAEARNIEGRSAEVRLVTREAYSFTASSAIEAVRRTLGGQFQPGYKTPASVWGDEFVLSINGSRYFTMGEKDDPTLQSGVQ